MYHDENMVEKIVILMSGYYKCIGFPVYKALSQIVRYTSPVNKLANKAACKIKGFLFHEV